jgi:hypothetical protein
MGNKGLNIVRVVEMCVHMSQGVGRGCVWMLEAL